MTLKVKTTGEDILGIAATIQGIWKVTRVCADGSPILGNVIVVNDEAEPVEFSLDCDNIEATIAQGSRVWVGINGETFTDSEVVAPDPADPSKMIAVASLADTGFFDLPLTKHIAFLWRTDVANLRTNYGLREWVDALSPYDYLEKHGFAIEEVDDGVRVSRGDMSTGWFEYGKPEPLGLAINHVRKVFELIA